MTNKRTFIYSVLTAIFFLAVAGIITIFVFYSNPFWAVLGIFILVIVIDAIAAIVLFNSDRQVEIKVSWLLIIVVLPVLGTLFYIWLGSRPFNVKKRKEYNKDIQKFIDLENFEYSKSFISQNTNITRFFAYNYHSAKAPIYKNNSIRIIEDNVEYLKEIVNLIRSAQKTILLQTYIFRDNLFGLIILSELLKKRQDGVEIFILYDWLGGRKIKRKNLKLLLEKGINVGIFNSPGINYFKSASNYRLHAKALIVDNKTAIYGGSNISSEYSTFKKNSNNFRDLNFVIEGEACNSLSINFFNNWMTFTKWYGENRKNKKEDWIKKFQDLHKLTPMHKVKNTKVIMQLLQSSPDVKEKSMEQTLVNLILKAKKSIYISTPFLCPSKQIVEALNYAVQGGIDVRIVVPNQKDNLPVILNVNRSWYPQFLNTGCKIYEYAGFMHSKYVIIDDVLTFTGSCNLDYRSFWINFETVFLIYNKEFTTQMLKVANDDFSNSRLITKDIYDKTYAKKGKVLNFFLRVIYPLI